MVKAEGAYRSDGHFGEVVENPYSHLRFMVLCPSKASPDAWEGRLAIVVRRRDGDEAGCENFDLGEIHLISPHGWDRVDDD